VTHWGRSWRADPRARGIADRHYNRQHVGADQFVPPGRCHVLLTHRADALWITSWPLPEFVRHRWPGAWVCSCFRNESDVRASDLILEAIAHTRGRWPTPPEGLITFVDPRKVPPVMRRGRPIFGYCFLKAGFTHVGFTEEEGLWAWHLEPSQMPAPAFTLTAPLLSEEESVCCR
jgi:hypothetical protein